jgi:AcrR family transcriptional regulator
MLRREDWLRAARLALLTGGAAAVRVERLAEALGVTKGSFYWHFRNRDELLEALLREWEEELGELDGVMGALPEMEPGRGLEALTSYLEPRVRASEAGELPSDAAIFAWAAADDGVARRVNAAEAERIAFMQRLVGDARTGEFLYLAYMGFVMRRRRDPSAAGFFPVLGWMAERLIAREAAEVGGPEPRHPAPGTVS